MKKYLLPETGNFYKANMHTHTCLSDGKPTPEEMKEHYKSLGYSIIAFTDHDVFIPHPELNDDEFLALHGFEFEVNEPGEYEVGFNKVKTCHLCVVALDENIEKQPCWHREKYLFGNAPKSRDIIKFDETKPDFEREYTGESISRAIKEFRDNGFFVTYNHPTWSRESYPEYIRYKGLSAFEIFNGGCINAGWEDYNPRTYEDLLESGQKIYCIAGDDNHNLPPHGYAWTTFKASELNYKAIASALKNGEFYASEGPEIFELYIEDGRLFIKTSEAEKIVLSYEQRMLQNKRGENGGPVTSASFELATDMGYFRVTVIDKYGKKACTNAYFPEDLGLLDNK